MLGTQRDLKIGKVLMPALKDASPLGDKHITNESDTLCSSPDSSL